MESFQQVLDILMIQVVASLSSLHISQKLAPCVLGIGVPLHGLVAKSLAVAVDRGCSA